MSGLRWSGKVALVTGANSGIGAAVTRRLLKLGLTVIALDRNVDDIQFIQEWATKHECCGQLHPKLCDVRHENDVLEIFRWIETCLGGVDVLVNSAGITGQNSLIDGSPDEWRHLLDVNVVALCLCTREAVASMQRRNVKDGHIFNLSSTLAHKMHPYGPLHFYAATKHAVTAVTESLREELKDATARIRVTSISPGLVKSNIFKSCLGPDIHEAVYKKTSLDPSDVASAVEYALSCPSHVEVNEIVVKPVEPFP